MGRHKQDLTKRKKYVPRKVIVHFREISFQTHLRDFSSQASIRWTTAYEIFSVFVIRNLY